MNVSTSDWRVWRGVFDGDGSSGSGIVYKFGSVRSSVRFGWEGIVEVDVIGWSDSRFCFFLAFLSSIFCLRSAWTCSHDSFAPCGSIK